MRIVLRGGKKEGGSRLNVRDVGGAKLSFCSRSLVGSPAM